MQKSVLTFGARDYAIRPLTLGQLRAIGIGAARLRSLPADPAAAEAQWYDCMAEIVAAALQRDHPEMTIESVLALETDLPGLLAANRAILELSGLVKRGDSAPGETPAAPSDGARSTGS
jgi:hypothetical protein